MSSDAGSAPVKPSPWKRAEDGWITLCLSDDLQEGMCKGYDLQGLGRDDVFVTRQDGRVFCYINSCPHWPQATLPWKKDAYLDSTKKWIMCYGHGALFTIDQGLCVEGPCFGERLTAIPLRQRLGMMEIYLSNVFLL